MGWKAWPEIWNQCGRGDYSAIADNMPIILQIRRLWLVFAVLVMYTASLHPVNNHGRSARAYILLDVLLCSIAEYFYELCRILTSPLGESKYKQRIKILSDTTQQNV